MKDFLIVFVLRIDYVMAGKRRDVVQPENVFSKPENTIMSRLDRIRNWPELAQQSGWCATTLAKQCDVSVRTLERHFLENMGQPPKIWLAERRQQLAVELLNQQFSVKETAFHLGYKHATHFSREFKKHWGFCPTQFSPNSKGTDKFRALV